MTKSKHLKISPPIPYKQRSLPQIRVITVAEFQKANAELKEDDPGNPGQTAAEYINMVVEEMMGNMPETYKYRIKYLHNSDVHLAIIHYHLLI